MRYGWDFEEYQVCVGETHFQVGKASCAQAPQPGGLGGWASACHRRPQESRSARPTGQLSQMPPTCFSVMVQGASEEEEEEGRAPHGICLPGPGAADFHLFPPSNWAWSLCMTFFPQTALKLGT